MADFGIKPDLPLQAVPQKRTSISDLLGTATKAMELSRLSELYPELIKKTTAEAAAAETDAQKSAMGLSLEKAQVLTNGQVSLMFNPLVVAAAQGQPVDKNKLLEMVTENARIQSENAGIEWETQGKQLAAPYITRAVNDPASLQGYIKERMFAGLDQATRANMMTPELVTSLPGPAQVIRAEGVARPLKTEDARAPVGMQSEAPRGVTSRDMTAPIQPKPVAAPMAAPTQALDPGFPVRFPVRRAGDIRPFAPGEEAAQANGEATRTLLLKTQADVPRANRSVGEILRIANELEKDIAFTVGKPADLERAIRVNFGGEARYQELAKDIAQVQMALNQATGATTDQRAAQVAEGTGNATYDPKVLIKIARRLKGELAEIDARATGAQKFAQKLGDSNLPEFLQQWTANSDLRIFESMAILRDIRDPKLQQEALDKIFPKTEDELAEFQQKYRKIKKLTETGTLR
jgi:hypothetical protein